MTPAVKIILWTNIALFLLAELGPTRMLFDVLGFTPEIAFDRLWIWQPVTYMFMHAGLAHILFNMLMLWMFGVELERAWGTVAFTRYYFVCGLGAAAAMLLWGVLPIGGEHMFRTTLVGASGALYGLLLAYGQRFPDRPIYLYFIFAIPAKYFVMIVGAISLYLSVVGTGNTAHMAHLGGLITGYLYLHRGGGGGFVPELKYRYLKWKMGRMRKKFDVIDGGGDRWKVH